MLLYLLTVVFVARLRFGRNEGFSENDDWLLQAPQGQVPKCPENIRDEPYNQRLEGVYSLRPP